MGRFIYMGLAAEEDLKNLQGMYLGSVRRCRDYKTLMDLKQASENAKIINDSKVDSEINIEGDGKR